MDTNRDCGYYLLNIHYLHADSVQEEEVTHSERLSEVERLLQNQDWQTAARRMLPLLKLKNAKRRTRIAAHSQDMYELLLECQKIKKGLLGKRVTALIDKINMFEGEDL